MMRKSYLRVVEPKDGRTADDARRVHQENHPLTQGWPDEVVYETYSSGIWTVDKRAIQKRAFSERHDQTVLS